MTIDITALRKELEFKRGLASWQCNIPADNLIALLDELEAAKKDVDILRGMVERLDATTQPTGRMR